VKQQHWILAGFGLVLLLSLYFFGQTIPPKKKDLVNEQHSQSEEQGLSFNQILAASKQRLTPDQLQKVQQLENAVVRGDIKTQQINAYHQLAQFWKDSTESFLPAAYYTAEAAKLENIEKKLTFAAHLFLDNLRGQGDPKLKTWMATNAKELFERVLELNAGNDSAKVGLGSAYMFGNLGSNPMQGILMIREVADRDPHNMYAQMTLGLGAVMTGQFDRAIDRFKKVVDHQPANIEAVLNLAEAYELKGVKDSAIIWYQKSKQLIQNPGIQQELDLRINSLR
jgi:tetratricopeptide (TPR) repeat protein